MSGPYSPYGSQGGDQYGTPGGQWGAPNDDPYGAPGGFPPPGYPPPQGYLQGGPVDFQNAIRLQLANVTNFQGRASLSAYWWCALAVFIVEFVLQMISIGIGSTALTVLIDIVVFAVGLSVLSVAVRRLHDSDKSGWLILLGLIPVVGWIITLILLVLPGTRGPNRFG